MFSFLFESNSSCEWMWAIQRGLNWNVVFFMSSVRAVHVCVFVCQWVRQNKRMYILLASFVRTSINEYFFSWHIHVELLVIEQLWTTMFFWHKFTLLEVNFIKWNLDSVSQFRWISIELNINLTLMISMVKTVLE